MSGGQGGGQRAQEEGVGVVFRVLFLVSINQGFVEHRDPGGLAGYVFFVCVVCFPSH